MNHLFIPRLALRFCFRFLLNKNCLLDKKHNNWKDNPNSLPAHKLSWLDIENTFYAKEKFVKILVRKVLILKQQ